MSYIEKQKSVEVIVLSSPFVQYVAEASYSLLTPDGERRRRCNLRSTDDEDDRRTTPGREEAVPSHRSPDELQHR